MYAPPTELIETAIVLVKPVGRWWKWKCWVNNLSLSVVYTGHVISHMCSCALHRNHGFPSIKIIFLYTLTHFSNTELQVHASREVDDWLLKENYKLSSIKAHCFQWKLTPWFKWRILEPSACYALVSSPPGCIEVSDKYYK